jgi:hypothetical protein
MLYGLNFYKLFQEIANTNRLRKFCSSLVSNMNSVETLIELAVDGQKSFNLLASFLFPDVFAHKPFRCASSWNQLTLRSIGFLGIVWRNFGGDGQQK